MSQKRLPKVPKLPTLHDRPSWVCWSGRVDRSACAEVRVGEVWRRVEAFKRAPTFAGREALGSVVMHPRWLRKLHAERKPRELQGDYRWKSHAMQPVRGWNRAKRWERSLKDLAAPTCDAEGVGAGGGHGGTRLIANPNRGATLEKMFGLPVDEWEQELTVERWVVGKVHKWAIGPANLAGKWDGVIRRYFLVCPGKALGYHTVPVWRPDARRVTPTERQKWWWAIGRDAWGVPCSGKCYKLFLPLCTQAELEDSLVALEWLKMVERWRRERRVCAAVSVDEQVVAARYGPLFGPRRMVCGRCLGLHYGKVKNVMERWSAQRPMMFDARRRYGGEPYLRGAAGKAGRRVWPGCDR